MWLLSNNRFWIFIAIASIFSHPLGAIANTTYEENNASILSQSYSVSVSILDSDNSRLPRPKGSR